MDINELIIYRNLEYQELFQDMACLMGYADSGQPAGCIPLRRTAG